MIIGIGDGNRVWLDKTKYDKLIAQTKALRDSQLPRCFEDKDINTLIELTNSGTENATDTNDVANRIFVP
jgi:hypothetical protein